MLWEVAAQNLVVFLKINFFQNFDRSKLIFDRSKMFQFQFKSFWLTRSIQPVFGSIEAIFDRSNVIFDQSKIVLVLFKKEISTKSSLLFQTFSNSLSPTHRSTRFLLFLAFSSKFFAQSLSPKAGKTSLPLPLHLFSKFHAFFMHFLGIFTIFILVVLDCFLALSFSKESWVFVGTPYLSTLCGLIWLNWCVVRIWNFRA